MSVLWLLSILIAVNVCFVCGETSCRTPSDENGECISIYDCEVLSGLLRKGVNSAQELELLRKSVCDKTGDIVKVCCPIKCSTADGSVDECVGIQTCPHFYDLLRPPISQANKDYVRNFTCKGSDTYSVCCVPGFKPNNTSLMVSNLWTSSKYVSVCNVRQNAFPPEPNSECGGYDGKQRKIRSYGGEDTGIQEYPWLTSIEYEQTNSFGGGTYYTSICGGSLISGKYGLTAAVSISPYVIKNFGQPKMVALGEYDKNKTGSDCMKGDNGNECNDGELNINIERYIPHPEYKPDILRIDISVVRLERMTPYTNFIRPIFPLTYNISVDQPTSKDLILYVTGWGVIETSGNSRSSHYKLDDALPYVDLKTFKEAYDPKFNMTDRKICAGGKFGVDTCHGDSGGPLMHRNQEDKYELHGEISFGGVPRGQGKPGVFTKVPTTHMQAGQPSVGVGRFIIKTMGSANIWRATRRHAAIHTPHHARDAARTRVLGNGHSGLRTCSGCTAIIA